MKIYTKSGDHGDTGLFFGGRVPKADQRCAAYGAVDESVSALGMARALTADEWVKSRLMEIQRELFTVGAELATLPENRGHLEKSGLLVTPEMVARLERWIDEASAEVELPPSFIVPGGSPASGAMDVARTTIRRAEREVVALSAEADGVSPELLRYLNRLSDLVFMLARFEDRHQPIELLRPETSADHEGPG